MTYVWWKWSWKIGISLYDPHNIVNITGDLVNKLSSSGREDNELSTLRGNCTHFAHYARSHFLLWCLKFVIFLAGVKKFRVDIRQGQSLNTTLTHSFNSLIYNVPGVGSSISVCCVALERSNLCWKWSTLYSLPSISATSISVSISKWGFVFADIEGRT